MARGGSARVSGSPSNRVVTLEGYDMSYFDFTLRPLREIPAKGYCVHSWCDRLNIYRVRKHRGDVVDVTIKHADGWQPLDTRITLSADTLVRSALDHKLVGKRMRALRADIRSGRYTAHEAAKAEARREVGA